MEDKLIFERIYNAPIAKVWEALTNPVEMKKWYFTMMGDFKPQPGFETNFTVVHNNTEFVHLWKVTEAVPFQTIAYEWKYVGYPGNSQVRFDIHALSAVTTRLVLTFEILETFRPDENPDLSIENFNEGWTHFTKALQDFVEN